MIVEKKKYIIELPKNTHWIQWIMEGTKDHHPYMDYKQVEDLTLYTEPDLDAIRNEAYEKGVQDTKQHWVDAPRTCAYKLGYENGLNDAWEAARKIIHMPEGDLLNIFTECYSAVCTSVQVFLKYDASECIEKIRQYEQEHDSEIKVGDEVDDGDIGIVTRVFNNGFYVMWPDGTSGFHDRKGFRKTGRHFPEIAEVIKKMREQ